MASDGFDPYHKWLGIPPKDQPANHYRLLGVSLFENDQDVIVNAADRQMAHIRSLASGKHSDLSQKLLNEISRAKLILLSKDKREQYDAALRQLDLGGDEASPPPVAPPMGSALGRAKAVAPPLGSSVGRAKAAVLAPVAVAPVAVAPVAVAPVAVGAAPASGLRGAVPGSSVPVVAPPPAQPAFVGPSISVDDETSVSAARRRPAAPWYSSPATWVAVGLVSLGGAAAYAFLGGAGEDAPPIARGEGKPSSKATKTAASKTGEAASTSPEGAGGAATPAPASTTESSSGGAVGEGPKAAPTVLESASSGGGSTAKPPRVSGGSWPTLPIDKSAIRDPKEMAALQELRERANTLDRMRDWNGLAALLADRDELLAKDADLLYLRAGAYVNLNQLDKAERDLAKRVEVHQDPNPFIVHELVATQIAAGKKEEAKKTVAAAFDRFEGRDDHMPLARLAYMCVSSSDPGVPWSRVVAVARRAVAANQREGATQSAWFVSRGCGAALARQAAAEKDQALAKEAVQTFSPTTRLGWDHAFLSLAYQVLGDSAAVNEHVAAASNWNRSYLGLRSWHERMDVGNVLRDLDRNYGLKIDLGPPPPAGLAMNIPGGNRPPLNLPGVSIPNGGVPALSGPGGGPPRVNGPGGPLFGDPTAGPAGGPNSNSPFGPGGTQPANNGPGGRTGGLPTDGTWTPESNGPGGNRPGGLNAIAKKPAPTGDALKAASASIRELFKKEFDEAKKPDAKLELARRIAGQGRQLANDPNAQYAAFAEAKDLALAAGDTALAWDVLEEASGLFDMDVAALQMEVLAKDNTLVKTPVHAKLWCERAEKVLALAVSDDDYDLASRLGRMGVATSKKTGDPIVIKSFADSSTEIEAMKKAYGAMEASLKTLDASPDDAAANGVVGKFYALQKRDWPKGVKHLAKGDDASLKAAAEKELARPSGAAEQAAVGDLWYQAAEDRPAKEKRALQGRALVWYKTAEPQLEGLARATVSKRLDDFQTPLWDRIRAALKSRKFTPSAGAGTTQVGTGQFEIPVDPRILIGLEFSVSNFSNVNRGNYSMLSKVNPIYLSPTGKSRGPDGESHYNIVEARPGYAVGSITVNYSNEYVHGLSVTFVAIEGGALNPRDSYTTQWYGSKTGGMTVQIGTNSAPIISLGTQATSYYLRGVQGLLAP